MIRSSPRIHAAVVVMLFGWFGDEVHSALLLTGKRLEMFQRTTADDDAAARPLTRRLTADPRILGANM